MDVGKGEKLGKNEGFDAEALRKRREDIEISYFLFLTECRRIQ